MEFLSLGTEFCYSIAIVSVKIWKKSCQLLHVLQSWVQADAWGVS